MTRSSPACPRKCVRRHRSYRRCVTSIALERRTTWDLVCEWLQLGVAVLPGTAFGPFPDRVRLSLATRKEDVVEAVRRLREHYAGPGAKGAGK